MDAPENGQEPGAPSRLNEAFIRSEAGSHRSSRSRHSDVQLFVNNVNDALRALQDRISGQSQGSRRSNASVTSNRHTERLTVNPEVRSRGVHREVHSRGVHPEVHSQGLHPEVRSGGTYAVPCPNSLNNIPIFSPQGMSARHPAAEPVSFHSMLPNVTNSANPMTAMNYFVARQSEGKDLPRFGGDPRDYPNFISHFNRTTRLCGYSNDENLNRLQKCLHGEAREAVYALLALPESVPKIMDILQYRFGRPEYIIGKLSERLKSTPAIRDHDFSGIIKFTSELQNYITSVELLGCYDFLIEPSMLRMLVSKLPTGLRVQWGEYVVATNVSTPRLNELAAWLERKSEALSVVAYHENTPNHEPFPGTSKSTTYQNSNVQSGGQRKCKYCEGDFHDLDRCSKWLKDSLSSKWSWAARRKLCYKCLKPNHSAPKCKKEPCGLCQGQHHSSLHKPEHDTTQSKNLTCQIHSTEKVEPIHTNNMQWEALLRVLPVRLYGAQGSVDTYALFDEGSTVTMIESTLARQIGVSGEVKPLSLSWTGQMARVEEESEIVQLEISGCAENDKRFKLYNVRTVRDLGLSPQSYNLEELVKRWPFVAKGAVAHLTNAKPQILIGQDNWPLLKVRKSYSGPWNGPVVSLTWLGWVLHGNVPHKVTSTAFNSEVHNQLVHWEDQKQDDDESLHELVTSHFLQDNFLISPASRKIMSEEDNLAVEIFNATTRFLPDEKRWETGLLWKPCQKLPDSRRMAQQRLSSLERRFDRDPQFAEKYCQKMEENFSKGYARKLTPTEIRNETPKTWYLPHMGVVNPNKPGKLRICFDASAKSNGFSFNDFIYTGPDLYASLIGLLVKFRLYPIAFTGDIREMFPQVRIRADDQNAQRFLWRGMDRNKPPDVCVMQVMLFGSVCSPYAAQEIRNRNAQRFSESCPRAVHAITSKHYMDDYIDCVPTEEEGIQLLQGVMNIHKEGGFILCNITSNSVPVLESVPSELRSGTTTKILGLMWDTSKDELSFNHLWERIEGQAQKAESTGLTKRKILKIVMKLYDPLGFLLNYTIQAKILLQQLWQMQLHWDDVVPEASANKWRKWLTLLQTIVNLKIPRYYSQLALASHNVELHIFCDASASAYAAVAYLRFESTSSVEVSFIAAQARVAPIKLTSIPRLELQAAVLGGRLGIFIQKELRNNLKSITFWSDSRVVLYWIRSKTRKFKIYVANRVSEILEESQADQWRWVPTAYNPADLATRWKPESLSLESPWLYGPGFLVLPKNQWPAEDEISLPTDILEVRQNNLHHVLKSIPKVPSYLPDVSKFSNWYRLLGATAWVTRYITDLRKRLADKNRAKLTVRPNQKPTPLLPNEIHAADLLWCRKVQEDAFSKDLQNLVKHGELPARSRLENLNPYFDEETNLLRIRGRIDAAAILDSSKRPIVLEPHHPYTRLLIMRYHRALNHQGRETVLNEIRQKYWVLQARTAVRDTIRTCRDCHKRNSKPVKAETGALPKERLEHHVRPFTNVGLDYFGPMSVAVGRRREKRYGVIFTCMSTRAIHLEVAHDLTTDAAIMAIRRFSARRGAPTKIFSDNGTNLRGAEAELKRCLAEWNQAKLCSTLAIRGIKWMFNPPGAPHMGGCWERLIRSVKGALKAVLNSIAPKDEVLVTLLVEVEGILNSRPLTHVSLDPTDEEALTPNHFLLGSSSLLPIVPQIPDNVCLKRSWRVAQQLTDKFWRRWVKEYLPTLLTQTKFQKSRQEVDIGDVVLIVEPNGVRGTWPMGVIVARFPGQDGKTRVVDVQTKSATFRRHVSKLCPLAVKTEEPND